MSIRHTLAGLILMLSLSTTSAAAQFNGLTVTPDGGALIKPANTTGQTAVFTIAVTSVDDGVFDLACTTSTGKFGPRIGNCAVQGPNPVTVPGQGSATVTVTFDTYGTGSGTLTLSAATYLCDPEFDLGCEADDGTYTVTVTNVGFAPLVADTSHRAGLQDYGLCAAACFAATYAQGTVPYVSRDVPRNVTLVYNGDRADPHPFVHVDVAHDPASPYTPDHYELSMTVDGAAVTFVNGEQTLKFAYGGTAAHRLGGQFDASTWSTGVYPAVITVASKYAGGLVATAIPTKLIVVNENNSQVARGWTLAGIQRLYEADNLNVLITEGDGSAVAFERTCGTCAWMEPDGEFSILRDGQPGGGSGWTRVYRDSTKVVFDGVGQMLYVEDRFGNRTSISYSPAFAPRYITDPQNLVTTVWTSGGKLDYIKDPFNRTTDVTVDGSGRLTGIQDPDGVWTTFGYDGTLRLSTITDRGGNTSTLGYDAQQLASGRLVSVTGPGIPVYGAGSQQPVDSLISWQKQGVPYGSTATPFAAPQSDTVRARLQDPGGHVSIMTVDRYGQPHTVTDPVGNVVTRTYNADGQLLSLVDPLGTNASYTYVDGFLSSTSEAGVETYLRKAANWFAPDSIHGEREAVRLYLNSATGAVDSARVGGYAGQPADSMHWMRYSYDATGRVTEVRDPENHLVRQTWYSGTNGNRSKDSTQLQRAVTYGYNTYGLQNSVAQAGQPTRTATLDILNRVTHRYDGVNPQPTVLEYGTLYLDSVTDPAGQIYRFAYNAAGWITAETDPLGNSQGYEYSLDGERRRWTNRRGEAITYTYDALHRRRVRSGTNVSDDTLSYGDAARLVVGAAAHVVDSIYHNARGTVDSAKTHFRQYGKNFWVRYYYHPTTFTLDSVKASGGPNNFTTRRYAYNAARGTLDSIALGSAAGSWTKFLFNPDRQATETWFNGSSNRVIRTFSEGHGLTSATSPSGYAWAMERSGVYDLYGRLEAHYGPGAQTGSWYGYDGLGRLVEDTAATMVGGGGYDIDSITTYAYDAVGNRTDGGGAQYGVGNRIESFQGCSYTTDVDGNVTARTCGGQTTTFSWSSDGRLWSIDAGTPNTDHEFRYDAFGRLVRKWGGTFSRHFVWDRARLFAELNWDASAHMGEYSYYPGLDNLHAFIHSSGRWFAHADAAGNVVALTDATNNVGRTYAYTPWGEEAGGVDYVGFAGEGRDRARFKGALRYFDEDVELYYMRNRWYEPQTGRFLSEDPIGLNGGMNLYAYGSGDPISSFDPTGTEPCTLWIRWLVTREYPGGPVVHREELQRWFSGDCMPGDEGDPDWWRPHEWGWGGSQRRAGNSCTEVTQDPVARAAIKAAYEGTVSNTAEHATWWFDGWWRHAVYARSTPTRIIGLEPTPQGARGLAHGHLPTGAYRVGGVIHLVTNRGRLSAGDMLSAYKRDVLAVALEGGVVYMGTPAGKHSSCKF